MVGVDLVEIQHVVDDGHQMICGKLQGFKQVVGLFAVLFFLHHQMYHPHNPVQRRADLVAHHRKEVGFGLRCLFGDGFLLFQCVVLLLQRVAEIELTFILIMIHFYRKREHDVGGHHEDPALFEKFR